MTSRIATIGLDLLDTAVAALTAPPERRVLTISNPTDPLEIDQLAIGWLRTFRGVPGQEEPGPTYENTERSAEYVVRLIRCLQTATGEADTDSTMWTAAASGLMDEAEELSVGLLAWRPPNPHTTSGRDDSPMARWVGPAQAVRAQGRSHAFAILVHAAL